MGGSVAQDVVDPGPKKIVSSALPPFRWPHPDTVRRIATATRIMPKGLDQFAKKPSTRRNNRRTRFQAEASKSRLANRL
ncbi:MAG: hypothetical protein L0Y50_02880 [Beijerinckiaceae bacterium]|nr:hypothetical protein [Beijerinckiaceae bacterium]